MKTLDELGISATPWVENNQYIFDIYGCVAASVPIIGNPQKIADARLIAAAPELYEALRGLLEIVCDDCKEWYGDSRAKCIGCPRVKAAKAALAKASGESNKGETK